MTVVTAFHHHGLTGLGSTAQLLRLEKAAAMPKKKGKKKKAEPEPEPVEEDVRRLSPPPLDASC